MVELWMRKREMGDEDENDVENTRGYEHSGIQLGWLGLEGLISVKLHTWLGLVPAVSGMVNQLAHGILYVPVLHDKLPYLFSCLSFSSCTILSSKNTKFSQPSLSPYIIILSWHRVQHTPSAAYTEYCIHRVLHTRRTVSSQDRLSLAPSYSHKLLIDLVVHNSLHSDHHEITNELSLSFHRTCLPT